ncbi:MAG: ribonuclease III [Anaerolineae bacterium]
MSLEPERQRQLAEFSERIGFAFENPALLNQALTHSSFSNENPTIAPEDNQRLEYLGDALLGFLVAEWLYERYPASQEGELTSLRIFVIQAESLAHIGRKLQIGQYLTMGRGEDESGGRQRSANLCDAVEALIAALYLDRGLDATRALVRQLLEGLSTDIEMQRSHKNAKSYLQEYTQSALQVTPTYAVIAEQGPDHERCFVAQVRVSDEVWGEGSGRSKQAAEQAAARAAIDQRSL